ncbi:MAG: acyl-CoA dehydrogenase N-terminal domain-containing protein, partial [Endozoicomonadaceae bacterium]|nr:acyl-CoA dehydrogenase N-terminal domain-containing protein [Endozoicomonadaceae bacterium]
MLNYQAPLKDMHFILNEVFETEKVWHENTTLSNTLDYATAADILEECARFASNELFPLNRSGDETGLIFQSRLGIGPFDGWGSILPFAA